MGHSWINHFFHFLYTVTVRNLLQASGIPSCHTFACIISRRWPCESSARVWRYSIPSIPGAALVARWSFSSIFPRWWQVQIAGLVSSRSSPAEWIRCSQVCLSCCGSTSERGKFFSKHLPEKTQLIIYLKLKVAILSGSHFKDSFILYIHSLISFNQCVRSDEI